MNQSFILLVEDNYNDELLTRRAFKINQMADRLMVVRNGEEALDFLRGVGAYAARATEPPPALILLDLKLPKMDGLAVLKNLRAAGETRSIPVVILTSSDEEDDIRKSHDLGVSSYIRKPVNFNEFVETVRQLGLYWLNLSDTMNDTMTA